VKFTTTHVTIHEVKGIQDIGTYTYEKVSIISWTDAAICTAVVIEGWNVT
jgi:hypothetical protein